jgi:hypothetical protein
VRNGDLLRLSSLGPGTFFWLALLNLTFIESASAQTPVGPDVSTSAPAATQPLSAQSLEDWRALIATVPPPTEGCFAASYPSTEWHEVPCTTVPSRPYQSAGPESR